MNVLPSRKTVVVLSGAGISAESGLKTFRDSDGLWEGYSIDEVATWTAWQKNPHRVLEFYNMRRRQVLAAEPNPAHIALAALQDYFEVRIITQNIDDLHERAGSQHVLHLHGEILKMRSERDPRLVYPIYEDLHWGEKGVRNNDFILFEQPAAEGIIAFRASLEKKGWLSV